MNLHDSIKHKFVPRIFLGMAMLISACGLAGCQQFVILSYLLGGPPTIEPDFDAETGKSMTTPGKTVAVVCWATKELQWKYPNIDDMVSEAVAFRLGQAKIKVIHPDYVRAWVDEHPDWEKAEEIGKAFDADYVVELEISGYSLYEPSSTTLFRGRTEAYVNVVEVDEEGYGDRIFTKELDFEFPTKVPRSATEQSEASFHREYLSRLSERIGFLFYERSTGDMIPWAN